MKLEPLKTEHFERLYKPVGEIIVQWGLIDVALHYLAFAMFKTMGTTPMAQRWPQLFGYRLEKVGSLFKKRKEFAGLRNDAKDLIKRVQHLKDLRDMVVHGAAVRYVADKDAVLFERIDQVTKKQLNRAPDISHVKNPLIVRFEQFAVASEDCTTVTAAMMKLRQAVIDARDS